MSIANVVKKINVTEISKMLEDGKSIAISASFFMDEDLQQKFSRCDTVFTTNYAAFQFLKNKHPDVKLVRCGSHHLNNFMNNPNVLGFSEIMEFMRNKYGKNKDLHSLFEYEPDVEVVDAYCVVSEDDIHPNCNLCMEDCQFNTRDVLTRVK